MIKKFSRQSGLSSKLHKKRKRRRNNINLFL